MAEFVPDYDAIVWNGVVAPKNTPIEIVDKLNQEIRTSLGDPNVRARFADVGSLPEPMKPVDFGKFIAEDTEKWRRVIRQANISVE